MPIDGAVGKTVRDAVFGARNVYVVDVFEALLERGRTCAQVAQRRIPDPVLTQHLAHE